LPAQVVFAHQAFLSSALDGLLLSRPTLLAHLGRLQDGALQLAVLICTHFAAPAHDAPLPGAGVRVHPGGPLVIA
jgi:hypothetical protein